jgi:hypothetical protein
MNDEIQNRAVAITEKKKREQVKQTKVTTSELWKRRRRKEGEKKTPRNSQGKRGPSCDSMSVVET